jgi:hypothetical protein
VQDWRRRLRLPTGLTSNVPDEPKTLSSHNVKV